MNILIVAAHPDDEVLGCGGAIAKHTQQGDIVHVLILAEGATSRTPQRDRKKLQNELSALAEVAHQASEILGVTSLTLHDFPDNRMDSCDLLDITKVIEQEIVQYQPEIIYTHHIGDVNIDHCRIHQAVVTATRPMPGSTVKTLLFFEIASSTEWQTPGSAPAFVPNWFVDISETLSLKLEALAAYESEMRPWPHARSVAALEHLARWRGASVGVEAAEAFILGRRVIS
ncbi:MAG: PIG-L family deacetylase [Nostoc sp. JL34]|uniref:PIG-L deacetylase family protein n=1 Tax=Nostoc sp. JL34 TaxID=2815397 RepID=UPI001DFF7CDF|nr:PIG-L deacetylase family protein [Nostoc sp. JL34]MBN3881471.1 PIG-L family deacetylase [Nostoc sp. JL34]